MPATNRMRSLTPCQVNQRHLQFLNQTQVLTCRVDRQDRIATLAGQQLTISRAIRHSKEILDHSQTLDRVMTAPATTNTATRIHNRIAESQMTPIAAQLIVWTTEMHDPTRISGRISIKARCAALKVNLIEYVRRFETSAITVHPTSVMKDSTIKECGLIVMMNANIRYLVVHSQIAKSRRVFLHGCGISNRVDRLSMD